MPETGRAPSTYRPFLAIFAIALAVRLVHVMQIRSAPFFSLLMGDSRGYDEWAKRIAAGDWLGSEVFYQAPLYPYFLGVLYSIAGRSLLLVRLVQAAIGSASCVLVGLAVSRLISRRAGIAAGLMLALYAPAIFFDGMLQKSVLDVFFVSLAIWLIARIVEVRLKPDLLWLWLGLAIGALSVTRENAIVFIIVIVGWALFSPANRFRNTALLVVGLAIVLVPVAARNTFVGGQFFITTSQFGPNFYIGNNPKAEGTYASLRYGRGAPEYERQDATELAELALARRLSPGEVSSYWTDRALQFITSQPAAWARLIAKKAALLVNRTEMVDTEDQATYADWSLMLRVLGPFTHFGVLIPLAVLGMVVTWPRRSRLSIIYALLGAYAVSVVLFYVFARYRYPLVPLLIVFAAAGGVELLSVLKLARRVEASPRARWSSIAAIVAAATLAANWPLLNTNHMRAVTENNLGAALQAERRYDEADAHYRRAIAFRSDYAPAYSNLGTVLRARGRNAESIAAYEQAVRLQPEYPDARYNLGNVLTDEGRYSDAIAHFQSALQSAPASEEVHNNFGIALALAGRRNEAFAEFETAVRLNPTSPKAQHNLADALLGAGRTSEALDHYRRATELAPDEGSFQYDYGSALLEAGRPQDAAAAFRLALKTMPRAPEVHNNLGIALGSMGRFDDAIAEFEKALEARPDFGDARRNLQMAVQVQKRKAP